MDKQLAELLAILRKLGYNISYGEIIIRFVDSKIKFITKKEDIKID